MERLSPRWISLLAVAALTLFLSWLIVEPFVEVILWATVLAMVAYPLNRRLVVRLGRSMAALATTLVVLIVILIPLAFIGISVFYETNDVLKQFSQQRAAASSAARAAAAATAATAATQPATTQPADVPPTGLAQYINPSNPLYRRIDPLYRRIDSLIDLDQYLDHDSLQDLAKGAANFLALRSGGLIAGALGIVGLVVQMCFVLFTLYYLLRDSQAIIAAVRNWIPLEHPQIDTVFTRIQDVVFASLNGVLTIAAIQGALGGIAFAVLGLSSPVLWGVVMFFMSMVPMIGSTVIWIPAALFLLISGHPAKALMLVIWGGGVISMVDNLLRPKLVGQRSRLHELVVFFSVLGGLKVFGILGIVLGPVVIAVMVVMIDVVKQVNLPPVSLPPPAQNP